MQASGPSAERRDVLRRFFELSTSDQLMALEEIKRHLGAGAWADSEEERLIERRAEALQALEQVASELRGSGLLNDGEAPTAKQFDEGAIACGSEWRSGRVIRVFGAWRNAKRALLGGRVRESPAQARARARSTGRTRSYEEPLQALRLWLASEPRESRLVDYAAFAAEANKERGASSGSKPLPSGDAIRTSLRLEWDAVLEVGRGERKLEDAQEGRTAQLLEGLTDDSLVGANVLTLVLGIQTQHIGQAMQQGGLPRPVAKIGRNRAWLLGDLKKYRDGEPAPRRGEMALQGKVMDAPELAQVMETNLDYLRTLLSREDWQRVPKPAGRVGTNYYWLRRDVKKRLPKRTAAASR